MQKSLLCLLTVRVEGGTDSGLAIVAVAVRLREPVALPLLFL
jgi:hypothetical protein